MHRHPPSAPNREEPAPGRYSQMGIYGPFVWLAAAVLRLAMRAGLVSPEFLMPSRPKAVPEIWHRNRQLRRARASCLRRARRCALKHGKVNPEDYTPRAYAHFSFLDIMDKTIEPRQFREHYIRHMNLPRVQVYGMDSAHEITRFISGICESASGLMLAFADILGNSSENPAALPDPAPP